MLVLAALILSLPRIGLSINVPEGGGAKEYVAAIEQEKRLGLDGNQLAVKWDECEQQDNKPLKEGLKSAEYMGQDVLLTIATIDTNKKRVPAGLAQLGWDDPKLISRFDGFLRKLVPEFGNRVKWISLGNEADVYLADHEAETDAYIDFLKHERDLLHKLAPGIPVGVTTTWMNLAQHTPLIESLQAGSDAVVFTYYPTVNFQVTPDDQVFKQFDQMLSVAGERPLLLQEIGYPSSAVCGSSESAQAKFVSKVFRALKANQSRIAFASYFIQSDFGPKMIANFGSYYGLKDREFLAFLGSLGLQDKDQKPKAGWQAFLDGLKDLKE